MMKQDTGIHPDLTTIDAYSDWFLITQEQITAFAGITYDLDPDHIDPVYSAKGPFGVPTAQGFLTLALLPHLIRSANNHAPILPAHAHHINYGMDKVRWTSPIPVNTRIRAKFSCLDNEQRVDDSYRIVYEVAIELEDSDKPVMIAEWVIMISM